MFNQWSDHPGGFNSVRCWGPGRGYLLDIPVVLVSDGSSPISRLAGSRSLLSLRDHFVEPEVNERSCPAVVTRNRTTAFSISLIRSAHASSFGNGYHAGLGIGDAELVLPEFSTTGDWAKVLSNPGNQTGNKYHLSM